MEDEERYLVAMRKKQTNVAEEKRWCQVGETTYFRAAGKKFSCVSALARTRWERPGRKTRVTLRHNVVRARAPAKPRTAAEGCILYALFRTRNVGRRST